MINDMELETEICQKIDPIFIDTIKLFCKLDRYKDKLTEPAYKFWANSFFTLGKEGFDRMMGDYLIVREQEKYINKKRRKKLIPREGWFFHRKNKAAKYFFAQIVEEVRKFFEEPPVDKSVDGEAQTAEVNDLIEQTVPRNVANDRSEQVTPSTPQKPAKQGSGGADHKVDEQANAPKAGKEKK